MCRVGGVGIGSGVKSMVVQGTSVKVTAGPAAYVQRWWQWDGSGFKSLVVQGGSVKVTRGQQPMCSVGGVGIAVGPRAWLCRGPVFD